MFRRYLLALWAFSLPASALDLGLGAQLQLLIPDDIGGFRTSLPVYGPSFFMGLQNHRLELQLSHGTNDSVTADYGELSYRYHIETPFLLASLSAGAHFLRHNVASAPGQNTFGAHVGPGLVLRMGKGLEIPLNLRIHFQESPMITLGGGLIFLL